MTKATLFRAGLGWVRPVILILQRQRQEDSKFETTWGKCISGISETAKKQKTKNKRAGGMAQEW
jgi:hypothetical protein